MQSVAWRKLVGEEAAPVEKLLPEATLMALYPPVNCQS